MDIVSRIKTFMSQNSIGSSIFADKCDIPRPTLSQLLNGRNKKVSNEVLDKIHLAYPELSMMWLIFGEGEMMTGIGQNQTTPQPTIFDENDEFDAEDFSVEENSNPVEGKNIVVEAIQALTKTGVKKNEKTDVVTTDKKIVNIMVFYSDNSFESFVPNK